MGSIHIEDVYEQNERRNGSDDISSTDQGDGDGFRSFEVAGLASSTPTGMREEILLLSWLVVLLRTHEGGPVRFDWAYKGRKNGVGNELVHASLSTDEVMTGLQSNAGETAAAISRHIANVASSQHEAISSHVSLLLSTSYLSQGPKDEVSGDHPGYPD